MIKFGETNPHVMANKQREELNDLFSMFHDFEVIKLEYKDAVLTLTIEIPWGQLWDDLNYHIKLELTGCEFITCDYAELLNTPENRSRNAVDRSYIEKSTQDQKVISEIGLEVQRHTFLPPNQYEFICNSSKDYAGGHLIFTADGYSLFNKENEKIDLEQMKKWSTDWWKRIGHKNYEIN